LNKVQKRIQEAVEDSRVRFHTLRIENEVMNQPSKDIPPTLPIKT